MKRKDNTAQRGRGESAVRWGRKVWGREDEKMEGKRGGRR